MSGRYLHNMSVAPKTTIAHHGVGVGTRLVVELPPEVTDPTPERILDLLQGNLRGIQTTNVEHELQRMIESTIARLPLPSAAPVLEHLDIPRDRAQYCTELSEVVAILSKSSDRLFLRDKMPILSGIQSGRRVILILPDHLDWRNR